jgi:predicted HTH domain antitoxin
MTTNITIPIDTSILLSLRTTHEEFAWQILFAGALALYRQHKLSLGKAAEMAGYSRMAFIEELARRGEPIFDFTAEEVDELIAQADVVDKLLESRAR